MHSSAWHSIIARLSAHVPCVRNTLVLTYLLTYSSIRIGCSLAHCAGRIFPKSANRFWRRAAAGGIGQWRRVRSEISTCACPHGPIAAATSDRTAIRPVIEQRSASRAPRAHHFCHRLRLRPETMVRPPHRTRALGRSRGGIKHFGLSLTASRACDVLTRLRYLPRMTSWASAAVRCSCSECYR